jgi:hypothetical protein
MKAKRMRGLAVGLMLGGALYGCASLDSPMTTNEFRTGVKDSSLGVVEILDVKRPYPQVAETLRKKANECLAVTVVSEGNVYQGNMMVKERSLQIYKPTVNVTKDATELSLQVGNGKMNPVQKHPKDGYYILVADATPAGRGTKVTIYRGKWGKGKDVDEAIRGWANGERLACPDLNS